MKNLILLCSILSLIFANNLNGADVKSIEERRSSLVVNKPIVKNVALPENVQLFNEIVSNIIQKNISDSDLIEKIENGLENGNGFNINQVDKHKNSILMYAARFGSFDLLNYLLSIFDIKVNLKNNNNYTALMFVIDRFSRVEDRGLALAITELFLKHKPNLSVVNSYGKTALMMAKNSNQQDIEKIINSLPNDLAEELIEKISSSDSDDSIIKFIHGNIANVNLNYKDDQDITILMYAVNQHRSKLVNYLLKQKIDKNAQSSSGNTSLMLAVENNYPDIIYELLDNNVDYTLKNSKGQTALQIAQEKGLKEIDELFNCYIQKVEAERVLADLIAKKEQEHESSNPNLAVVKATKSKCIIQ